MNQYEIIFFVTDDPLQNPLEEILRLNSISFELRFLLPIWDLSEDSWDGAIYSRHGSRNFFHGGSNTDIIIEIYILPIMVH